MADKMVVQIKELVAAGQPAQAAILIESVKVADMLARKELMAILEDLCKDESNSAKTLEVLSHILQRALCGASKSNKPTTAQYALPFASAQNETWLAWKELSPMLSVPTAGNSDENDLDCSDLSQADFSAAVRAGVVSMLVAVVTAAS